MTRNGTSQVLRRQERIINLRLERQEERRQDEAANDQRFAENMLLDEGRGEIVAHPEKRGETRKPQRRLTGIEWMLSKGLLTELQAQGLVIYGIDYRTANVEVTLRSGLNFSVGGGEAPDPSRSQQDARKRLDAAQKTALHSQSEIIVCCNMIAGQQLTPREAAEGLWRHQARMEVTTSIAGSLLARHYGLGVDDNCATRA